MSNMSYCQFRNTLGDLHQCKEALEEGKEISPEEERALKEMLTLCEELIELNNSGGIDPPSGRRT